MDYPLPVSVSDAPSPQFSAPRRGAHLQEVRDRVPDGAVAELQLHLGPGCRFRKVCDSGRAFAGFRDCSVVVFYLPGTPWCSAFCPCWRILRKIKCTEYTAY